MSEFKNRFDDVEVSKELEEQVLGRVRAGLEGEKLLKKERKLAKRTRKERTDKDGFVVRSWWRNNVAMKVAAVFLVFVMIVPIMIPLLLPLFLGDRTPTPPVRPPVLANPPGLGTNSFNVGSMAQLSELLGIRDEQPEVDGDMWLRDQSNGGFQNESGNVPGTMSSPPPSPPPENSVSNDSSSSTYVQVDGMDEGDIVKNDGNYIYRLSVLGLTILRTQNGHLQRVTSLSYDNFAPIELYIRENKMIVIGGSFDNLPSWWDPSDLRDLRWWHTRVQIRVYDISTIQLPKLERFFEIDGSYETSRVRVEDGTLFFVVNYWPFRWCPDTWGRQVQMPYYRNDADSEFEPFPVENIYAFGNRQISSFMILGSLSIDEPAEVSARAYLSQAGIISVSTNNLYTFTSRWVFAECYNCNQPCQRWSCPCDECFWCRRYKRKSCTAEWVHQNYIIRFSLETLADTGYVTFDGAPPDRRAIDEHNGYLRVATTTRGGWLWWRWWGDGNNNNFYSNVFVFNSDLELVSSITEIAVGETMDSATFSGNFGYISTSPPWLIWDPLYTVNLTDPYNPTISDGLETDGINQLLIAVDGTPFAIGIGQDSLEGGSAQQTGVKIELYDMKPGTDETPESRAKFSIFGSSTWVEAVWNPRALLYMFDENSGRGLIGFSAESAAWGRTETTSAWESFIFAQGFYLFAFDTNDGTMEFLGGERVVRFNGENVSILMPSISNFDTSRDVFRSGSFVGNWQVRWENQRSLYTSYISRAVVNNGFLYTVADSVVAGYCLNTLARIDKYYGI
jgi:hypothetical protein